MLSNAPRLAELRKPAPLELSLLCLAFPWLLFTSSSIWTSTTSITVPLSDYYGLTNAVVTQLPNLTFSVLYILLGPFSAWITQRLTINSTLVLSALLMVIGDGCRVLSALGFGWLMAGNLLVALVAPLLFSNLSYVAMLCVADQRQAVPGHRVSHRSLRLRLGLHCQQHLD